MADEKTVLHVGPVNTRGGMANTIRIFSENPPDGWCSETLTTHIEGSALAKFFCWRRARGQLITRLKQNPPRLVHIHTASDYSWWRKRRVAMICNNFGIPVVMQIHSGKFHSFCAGKKGAEVSRICSKKKIQAVVLSDEWAKELQHWLPDASVINIPIEEQKDHEVVRESHQLLFMGRNDPVKGAATAIKAAKGCVSNVQLVMTGVTETEEWLKDEVKSGLVQALGWVPDEEKSLLMQRSTMILVPSRFEGQPAVVLEAMANGLPVLGSNAIAETVGDAGLVINSDDAAVWSKEIDRVLGSDELAQMSKRGRVLVEKHSLELIMNKWKELYEELSSKTSS